MHSSSGAARVATRPAEAAGEQTWLTTILRPAGSLDYTALQRLGLALGQLAAASDMAMLDLTATDVGDPRAFARALRDPAAAFERAGRCLLVIGASARLTAELDRAAVPVATLAEDALPVPVAA